MERKDIFIPGWARRRHEERKDAPSEAPAPETPGNDTIDLAINSTDFRSAMARNVRATFFLFIAMLVICCLVGYTFGWGLEILTYNHPNMHLLTPERSWWESFSLVLYSTWGMLGIAVMAALFCIMMLFTLWRGDRVLMRVSGARPADPEKDARLHNIVEEVAIAAGKPKPRVYVIESDALNAFATGIRPSQSCVAATRGIMERLNREELQGVMAHEMGHIINADIRHSVALAVMVGLIAGLSAMMREITFRLFLFAGSGSRRNSKSNPLPVMVPVLVIWVLVALLSPIAATLLKLAVSREREYLADATAVKLTRNPKALASALVKISENPRVEAAGGATAHLFIENPKGRSWARFLSTHPPIEDRVERLRNLR